MTHLGVKNPWARSELAPTDPLAGVRPGVSRVFLDGRYWQYTICYPVRPQQSVLETLALQTLGEFLLELRKAEPEVVDACLDRQRLSLEAPPRDAASVSLALGPIPFHAVASSTNQETAIRMALDRLALALNQLQQERGELLRSLQHTYGVTWARKV